MAPVRPTRASTPVTKSTKSSIEGIRRPRSLDDPYAVPHQKNRGFTKASKRHVKHATLLSRLQRTAADSRIKKRRRPSQKLVTDLATLGDALPETLTTLDPHRGLGDSEKTKYKTLKSRPGAMKRKEKMIEAERARFDKNLALLAFGRDQTYDGQQNGSSPSIEDQNTQVADPLEAKKGTKARWTAIREHISKTMETIDQKSTAE